MSRLSAPGTSLDYFSGHSSILEKVGQIRDFMLRCFIFILLQLFSLPNYSHDLAFGRYQVRNVVQDHLFLPKVCRVFLSPSMPILRCYLKVSHDSLSRFLPNLSFIFMLLYLSSRYLPQQLITCNLYSSFIIMMVCPLRLVTVIDRP